MNVDHLSVTIPIKEGMGDDQGIVSVWPLLEKALEAVSAGPITVDAARQAVLSSHGCAALANFLMLESASIHKMDMSFKVPLLILAIEHSQTDDGLDVILDDNDRVLFLETDNYLFAYSVIKDWQVDWQSLADEVTSSYEPEAEMESSWALDHLLEYADIALDEYKRPDDDL